MKAIHRERIKKLVATLRGKGERKYKQGRRYLCVRRATGQDEFCCLGVATDIYVLAHPRLPKKFRLDWEKVGKFDGEENVLHPKVMRWFGFTEPNPDIGDEFCVQRSAASINDAGERFPKIAELFENKFLEGGK